MNEDNVIEVSEQELTDFLKGDFSKLTLEKLNFLNETKRELYEAKYPLPEGLEHPGGFVEDAMNFINDAAVCPQPKFSLAAALCLAGVLYGRRVQAEDGQRTLLYTVCVGQTSAGKDNGLKQIARILDECGYSRVRLGQFTSDSALESSLKCYPKKIALLDEVGYFFQGVSDLGSQGGTMRSIKPALLELWSSAGGTWVGKQRAAKDGKDIEPCRILNPHLCLFGCTQPSVMWESLHRNDLRDGWLSRVCFFLSDSRPKPKVKPLIPIPETIRREVEIWKDDFVETHNFESRLITVKTDEAAQGVFDKFNDEIFEIMLKGDKSEDESFYLYGKAYENAKRIALILAVSRLGHHAVIEERDATYATKLVKYLIDNVIEVIREKVAENVDEKYIKRIHALIVNAGAGGITKSELTCKTQYIRRDSRDRYLEDLIEGGRISAIPLLKGGVRFKAI